MISKVDPSSAYNQLRGIMQAVNPYKPATIMSCKITMVNHQSMTADIFVPEVGMQYKNVPIAFASKGTNYGSVSMPAKNATGLVCFQDSSRPPVLIGCTGIAADSSVIQGWTQELVYEGEILHNGIGGSFVKLDKGGQVVVGAETLNSFSADSAGRNTERGLGVEQLVTGSKRIAGLAIPRKIDYSDYAQFRNAQLRLIDRQEIISGLDNFPSRDKADLINSISGFINYDLRDSILDEISQTIAMIQGTDTTPGFAETISGFVGDFRANLSSGEFATKLAEVQAFINQYILAEKGVKIIIEKGNATDSPIETAEDVLKLANADFATSAQNKAICFRFRLQDIATQTEKARITIDNDGNCLVRMKTLTIETERYTVHEVS